MTYYTHYSIWYVKELSDTAMSAVDFKEYEIKFDALEEIFNWIIANNKLYPWMYSEKEARLARKYNHMIPFVKYRGEIIGYTKVALNKVYVRDYDITFDLAANKAMFYDTTFLPEFRGKKLVRYLKNEISAKLKRANIQQIYAYIEPWNAASIWSNLGVGFKELCRVMYVRILFYRYYSCNPKLFLASTNLSRV